MTTTTEIGVATQVYQLYIKATPEAIWDALTTSTETYGYRAKSDYELRPGGVVPRARDRGHACDGRS